MPRAPQSRAGRYAALDASERAYELDELPDWELVFEFSRRAMSAAFDYCG